MGTPTLRQLRTFLAVVEAGSVSGGARSLHLTQPAASQQLRDLERALSVRLLDRGFFRIGYGEVGIDASMWGVTGVKSPLLSSLHVVGAQATEVRHTTRTPKPAWTASTPVATPAAAGHRARWP